MQSPKNATQRLLDGFLAYLDRRVLLLAPLGFAAGVPLTLVLITISIWLAEAGLNKAGIAMFAWVGSAWTWKFVWAPVVDRVRIPLLSDLLGFRRSWMLLGQLLCMGSLYALSFADPVHSLGLLVALAMVAAICSATHDIALDAWRVQVLERDLQGNGASTYQLGYRLAILACGAGALALASWLRVDVESAASAARHVLQTASDIASMLAAGRPAGAVSALNLHMATEVWPTVYRCLSALMLFGVFATLAAPEPELEAAILTPASDIPEHPRQKRRGQLYDAVIGPFADLFRSQPSVVFSIVLLLFVMTFRLSDSIAGTLVQPFLIELGFEYTQIAKIQKVFGTIMTLVGTFAGGALFKSWGAKRTLWLAGILQVASNLMFIVQARAGADPELLHLTISVENLSGGLTAGAFVAYLSNLCSRRYSATQYATLSALAMLGRTAVAGSVGGIADTWGWAIFFAFSTAAGLPGLVLLWYLTRRTDSASVGGAYTGKGT